MVTLASEARARIIALEHTGARLVLEQGTLSAHVVHRGDTQWTVVAGPFEVRVTGTRFDVVWSPALEVFELRLKQGAVTVMGPSLGNGRNLQEGEALHIDVREQSSDPDRGPIVPESATVTSSSVPLRAALPAAQTSASQTLHARAASQRVCLAPPSPRAMPCSCYATAFPVIPALPPPPFCWAASSSSS